MPVISPLQLAVLTQALSRLYKVRAIHSSDEKDYAFLALALFVCGHREVDELFAALDREAASRDAERKVKVERSERLRRLRLTAGTETESLPLKCERGTNAL